MRVRAFGAMREFADDDGYIQLEHQVQTVSELRQLLNDCLSKEFAHSYSAGLLTSCVFANDERLLSEHECIDQTAELAVLPPVAGG